MNTKEIFEECHNKRVEFVKNNIVDKKDSYLKFAHYCVINPIDYCAAGCKHCLYSSIAKKNASKISLSEAKKIAQFLTEARTKQVVFSGGGEPLENFNVILYLIEHIGTLEEVVIITSGFFAKDSTNCIKQLDKLFLSANKKRLENNLNPINIVMRISRDSHYINSVPTKAISNIIKYKFSHKTLHFDLLLRTTFKDAKNDIKDIISQFKFNKTHNDWNNIPIIDGLPCIWIYNEDVTIPIIFKPIYSVGRSNKNTVNYSMWNIVNDELESSQQFNLSIRGDRGQGHNYYGEILKGHEIWKKNGSPQHFVTLYNHTKKQIALYITAEGRVLVNNGSPDNYILISNIISWNDFLNKQFKDPLQNYILHNGAYSLLNLAQDIDNKISEKINKTNFVFSIAYLILENPLKRLFLMYRIIKDNSLDGYFDELISKKIDMSMNSDVDPIVGNQPSVYLE